MWDDVNTKLMQDWLFRMCHATIGVPVEYDDNIERKNTNPMLMTKAKNEKLIIPDE